MSTRLVIVYNADAGLAAALFDAVHKLVAPATYPCSLCAVTYGALTMRPQWRRYLASLPYPVAFFHRQDFRAAYPSAADWPLPLVATDRDGSLTPLLGADALAGLADVDALADALSAALAATGDRVPPACE